MTLSSWAWDAFIIGAFLVVAALVLSAVGLSVAAIVDVARRPAALYPQAMTLSKKAWLWLLSVGIVAVVVFPLFGSAFALVAGLVYWFNSRPKLACVAEEADSLLPG